MNASWPLLTLALVVAGCTARCEERRQPPARVAAPPHAAAHVDAVADGGAPSLRREKLSGYAVPGEELRLESRNVAEGVIAVTLPLGYEGSDTSFPLVLAFGGAGESVRPPRSGALAWMQYYEADEAVAALSAHRRLLADDFRGLSTPRQLRDFNKRLEASPYRGVILACPFSPPLSLSSPLDDPRYEAFIMDEAIPALSKTYRVRSGRIGVDGVSMGGARSMYFGLKHPETFASIGAVQGAFGRHMEIYRALVERSRDVLSERAIQLVTSDGDGLAPAVRGMHRLLAENDVEHEFLMLTGPHDYIFNQGPGVISLLAFHDEALWRDDAGAEGSLGVAGDDR